MTDTLPVPETTTPAADPEVTPFRRTAVRPFLACLLLLVAAVAWRRGAYFSGGLDVVVVAKGLLTLLALALVATAPSRGPDWSRLRVGPVPWLAVYAAVATVGAALSGDPLPTAVLAARLGLLTLTLVLLFRRYPRDLVLSALTGAMLTLALVGAVTGVGSLASEGRLYGGIPPLNANEIALLVTVPLLCLAWRCLQRTVRPIEVAAILPLLGIIWLTGTRTGLAALLLGVLIIVVMTARIPVPVVVLGAAAVPALLYVMFWTPLLASYATRGESAEGLLTLNSRTVAWTAALDYPDTLAERVLGVGLSVKVIPVSAMYRDEQILDSTWVSALVQAGVLGTAVLALVVLLTLLRVLSVPPPLRSLLLATVVTLTVISFLESGGFDTSVAFIAFCCFAMSAQELTPRRSS